MPEVVLLLGNDMIWGPFLGLVVQGSDPFKEMVDIGDYIYGVIKFLIQAIYLLVVYRCNT